MNDDLATTKNETSVQGTLMALGFYEHVLWDGVDPVTLVTRVPGGFLFEVERWHAARAGENPEPEGLCVDDKAAYYVSLADIMQDKLLLETF